jgi:hypothetical protein
MGFNSVLKVLKERNMAVNEMKKFSFFPESEFLWQT